MAIYCETEEEKMTLLEELEKQGYVWPIGKKPTDRTVYSQNVIHINDANNFYPHKYISWSWIPEYAITKFSDLVIPEDEKTYEDGLQDAWNVLKKAYEMDAEEYEKCFSLEGGSGLMDLPPQEAFAKIKAYEQSKEISVDDVVFIADEPEDLGCVISVEDDGTAYVLWNDGSGGHIVRKYLRKTGRNMRAVQKLLDELKKGL